MEKSGLQCIIENYFLGKTEIEYLDFWVTRNGVNPIK